MGQAIRTQTPALNTSKGVKYPYRSKKEGIVNINTVYKVKPASRKNYYVEVTVNMEKLIFLVDTGAEVSLISKSTPGLVVKDSHFFPVSITHQPVTDRGEVEVVLELGGGGVFNSNGSSSRLIT